ncbi:DUF3152 domain-containing protein [Saccharomonospora sp. NPDC006951]
MDRVTEGKRHEGQRAQRATRQSASSYPRESKGGSTRYRPTAQKHGERSRQGARRRVTAEPLAASWQPTEDPERGEPAHRKKKQQSRLRALISTYGWRAYALPILLVITALVVFDTTRAPDDASTTGNADSSGTAVAGDAPPVASENPAEPVDLNIPTAELPKGGKFSESGKGTWHVVPGEGKKVGEGPQLFTYTIEVEDGLDSASFAGDDGFAEMVESTLSNPWSWIGGGEVTLQRVGADHPNPDFRVSLTSPDTTHRPDVCGGSIPFETSCYRRDLNGENRVIINLARWVRGAKAWGGDMTGYRQYAINHEVGHALGNGHVGCAENDGLAPVMMQQTFGVANDYVAKLNDTPGGDQGTVPTDGKVCKVNAWPNPQAQPR